MEPRPSPIPIDRETAIKVWLLLIEHAGLTDSEPMRDNFICCAVGETRLQEYRFQGSLGFGGKVRYMDGHWSVYCYPEDHNSVRDQIITRTNEALKEV